jgi:hypothetical protein
MSTYHPGIPNCDQEVFQKGRSILAMSADSQSAEDFVVAVRERSGQRVDWHYSGGIAHVLYIGDREKVLEAVMYLKDMPDSFVRIMRVYDGDDGLYRGGAVDGFGPIGANPRPDGVVAGFMGLDGENVLMVEDPDE